jgi:hypothetical protein
MGFAVPCVYAADDGAGEPFAERDLVSRVLEVDASLSIGELL